MDKNTEDLIVQLFDEGKFLAEIAETVDSSDASVSRVLKRYNRSAWKRRYPDAQNFDKEKMIEDYQGGMRLDEILDKHSVSQTTLYRFLREAEIPSRGRVGASGKANYQYKHGNGSNRKRRSPCLTRQVVAVCLGHIVPRGWQLHHMDEDPANNNPENIVAFPSKSTHAKFHQQLLHLQRQGFSTDAILLALENDGILLPLPTHPIVLPHEKGRLDPPEIQEMPKPGQT